VLGRASVFLAISILCQSNVVADKVQTISWRHDFANARIEMQQKQRPMLLLLTMPGCVYCDRMKVATFKHIGIIEQVNKKYVAVQLNGREHPQIAKGLNLYVYPTTAIVDPTGKVLEVLHGFQPAAAVAKRMAVAHAKLNNTKVAIKPGHSGRK